jgi:hypothetical protein
MRRRVFGVLLVAVLVPSSSFAWGAAAHRFIMGRAIDRLPPEIKPFFDAHRDEIVLRVNDPDLWRVAGWNDDANHFLDLGVEEFGPYPFAALPRDYDAAVEKFGAAVLSKYGRLPWREAEESGNLRRAFGSFGRNAPFAAGNTILFAAVAAHYIQDAFQPLHATNNYDGQLTAQVGVHARFETILFERFESRLTVTVPPIRPMPSARDAAFDALLSSHQLVKPLLDADKEALGAATTYDQAYFDAFFAKVKPLLETQLAGAVAATAALITAAWEQSGKPALRTVAFQPPVRTRRPGRR